MVKPQKSFVRKAFGIKQNAAIPILVVIVLLLVHFAAILFLRNNTEAAIQIICDVSGGLLALVIFITIFTFVWLWKKELDSKGMNIEQIQNAKLNEARLTTLVELSQMKDASKSDLIKYSLERMVQLTKSEFAYIALVDEAAGTITMQSWSKVALKKYGKENTEQLYRLDEAESWGECVRQRKPIIINDNIDSKKDNPAGNAHVTRYITVPIFDNGSIVAVAGAVNKYDIYDDRDVMQLSLLASGMWKVLQTKLLNDEICRLAYYDSITGLPNRVLLIDILMTQLSKSGQDKLGGALLFIDIDNFKIINDNFGHTCGDILLMDVAERMRSVTDASHTIARIGGDEFVILYKEAENKEEISNFTVSVINEFVKPYVIGGNDFYVTASIGIALFPQDGDNVEDLLKYADMAMYCAKTSGKNTFSFYDQYMNDAIIQKVVMESSMRHALRNENFVLHYQPQVNLFTGKITGFEALIRWDRPGSSLINPGEFINLAEESGMIIPIGQWVLKTACNFAKTLHDEGYGQTYMSVNVSPVQLMQENFVESVKAVLVETGFPSEYLEIEITESVLMESFDSCIITLENLRKAGIKVSLDDFGSRYSSLNYLKRLPISTLKIDKAFIDDINSYERCRTLTGSIVLLAHKMGLKVIAEGVENFEQLDYLKQYECDIVQGYLLGKPIDGSKVEELLAAWNENNVLDNNKLLP